MTEMTHNCSNHMRKFGTVNSSLLLSLDKLQLDLRKYIYSIKLEGPFINVVTKLRTPGHPSPIVTLFSTKA